MRRIFFTLGLIASILPVALTIVELVVLALLGLLTRPRNTHSVLLALVSIAIAIGLGISLRYFAKTWAMCIAGIVSIVWLYLAVSTIFDVQHNPEKWQHGDGAEGVILLLPLGAAGVVGSTAILVVSRRRAMQSGDI